MKKLCNRSIACVLIAALIIMLLPVSVSASGYCLGDSGYTKISTLPNTYYATQAMAADDNYIYTFKMPSGDNNRAIIYRTDMMTRTTIALTNGADPSTSVLSELGHGNDMCAVVHNGKTYLYLISMYHIGHPTYSEHTIWKLEVSGTTVKKVAYYDVYDGTSPLNFAGLTLHSQSETHVRLLGHINAHIFYFDIGINQTSGSVQAEYGCSIEYKSATAPTGAPSYIYSGSDTYYGVQGMTYNNGYLYFIMTASGSNLPHNKNWILAYDVRDLGVNTDKHYNVQSETIYLTSSTYGYFLELESLCAVNGRMYFSANAGSGSSYYSAEDFVGHFNHYFDTAPDGVIMQFDNDSRENRWSWKHYIGSSSTAISPMPTAANGSLSGRLGALSVDGIKSNDSFVRMTAGDVYYRIKSGDILEIGLNYHCVSGTPTTGSSVYFTTNHVGGFTTNRMFESDHNFVEGKNTVRYQLGPNSGDAVGEIISQLRIDLFEGGTSDFLADYSIDYIYVGPEYNSPLNIENYTGNGTYLHIDFSSKSPMRNEADWKSNNVTFDIDQSKGIFYGTIEGADPYCHLVNNVAYRPAPGDVIDIRIKHNMTNGICGGLEFFYTTQDAPDFSGDKYLADATDGYDTNAYTTIRLYVPSAAIGKTITKIRIDPVSSSASENLRGTFEIDYIYLGPASKAPEVTYTVRFCNEGGTVLQTQSVLSGSGASYTGQTPTKAHTDAMHYTFSGWVNANGSSVNLGSVTQDMTVYPSFQASAHSFGENIIQKPTCTSNGSKRLTCSCGYSKTQSIPKTEHSAKSVAGKDPTCTENGLTQGSYCSVCGVTITAQQVIAAKGHTAVIDSAVAPTCTNKGLTEGKHCAVCHEVLLAQVEIPASAHVYKSIVTAPTCTQMGYTTRTCSNCGDTYVTDQKEPVGHTEVLDKAVAATCTENGLTEGKHCSVCGKILVPQQTVASTGHSYDAGVVIQAATCKAEGIKTFTCHCGSSYSEKIAKTAHALTYQSKVDATCETIGYNPHYACVYCEGTFVDAEGKYPLPITYLTIAATGHSLYFCERVESTCAANGCREHYACHSCQKVFSDANATSELQTNDLILPKTGHTVSLQSTIAATCTTAGRRAHYLCQGCGKAFADAEAKYLLPLEYLPISATGHSYLYEVRGEGHVIRCKNCAYSAEEAHKFDNGECICGAVENTDPTIDENLKFTMNISVGAAMSVSYNVMANAVNQYADFYLEVSKENADGEPTVITYGLTEGHEPMNNMANFIYSATFEGIAAKQMGDEFSTTLYAIDANGKIYKGETVTQSIKGYLVKKAAEEKAGDEFKTMAIDMLKYGSAAQTLFNYGTDNLVTSDLTEELLSYATVNVPDALDIFASSGEGVAITANVTVGAKVQLALSVFKAGLAKPDAVRCEIRDAQGKLLAEPTVTNTMNMMFNATYDNVGAREMRKPISATFFMGDEVITKTITWSIESYVAQVCANEKSTEADIAMVNAMLIYGDAVAAYMTSIGQ